MLINANLLLQKRAVLKHLCELLFSDRKSKPEL